jgi:hypothetical protein
VIEVGVPTWAIEKLAQVQAANDAALLKACICPPVCPRCGRALNTRVDNVARDRLAVIVHEGEWIDCRWVGSGEYWAWVAEHDGTAQAERDKRAAREARNEEIAAAEERGWARCAAVSKATDPHLTERGRAYDVIDRLEQVVPQFKGLARATIAEAVGRMTEETWNGMAR